MALDYFDDLEDLYMPALDSKSPAKARKELIKTMGEFKLKLPTAALSDAQLEKMPPHVLFGWQFDAALSLWLHAIPEAKLSPALLAAMKETNSRAYAYHEMSLGDDRAKAFVRIDAAMGVNGFEACIEGFADSIDAADRNCLAEYRVAAFEDGEDPVFEEGALDKRFVAAYTARRCQ